MPTTRKKSQIIFSRKGTSGRVGNTRFKLPAQIAGISLLATNAVCDMDDFREDGYVYGPDNKIRRKWFGSIEETRVWNPKLDNIAVLEAKRWKYLERYNAKARKLWTPMYRDIVKAKRFIAKIVIPGDRRRNSWRDEPAWQPDIPGEVVFEGKPGEAHEGGGISWNWLNSYMEHGHKYHPIETVKRNDALGQQYFDDSHRLSKYGRVNIIFHQVFLRAIQKQYASRLWKLYHQGKSTTLHLTINGRDYWFHVDGRDMVPLALPEDIVEEEIIS